MEDTLNHLFMYFIQHGLHAPLYFAYIDSVSIILPTDDVATHLLAEIGILQQNRGCICIGYHAFNLNVSFFVKDVQECSHSTGECIAIEF